MTDLEDAEHDDRERLVSAQLGYFEHIKSPFVGVFKFLRVTRQHQWLRCRWLPCAQRGKLRPIAPGRPTLASCPSWSVWTPKRGTTAVGRLLGPGPRSALIWVTSLASSGQSGKLLLPRPVRRGRWLTLRPTTGEPPARVVVLAAPQAHQFPPSCYPLSLGPFVSCSSVSFAVWLNSHGPRTPTHASKCYLPGPLPKGSLLITFLQCCWVRPPLLHIMEVAQAAHTGRSSRCTPTPGSLSGRFPTDGSTHG